MNPALNRRLVASASILLGLASSSARAEEKAPPRVFVGYLSGLPSKVNFRLYTHICQAFLVADGEGKVEPSRTVPDLGLVREAHSAGVKVLISLGGWGYDEQFASIVSKPEAEDRYVRSVLEIIDRDDYDGIDLDWEYPDTKDEVAGFERLSRRFRKDLDAIGARKGRAMALTMAASANPGTLRWLGRDFLVETMDWINVMTYDYSGPWLDYAGHNAPLFASSKQPAGTSQSVEATIRFLLDERKMPAAKLALGVPLYGRGFAVAEPYQSTQGIAKAHLPEGNYSQLLTLERDKGWTRRWDDQTKTPWLLAPDHKAVIGYDDAESVALKADWAKKQGLRGVFFWQINADRLPDGTNPLQEAARKRWDAAGAAPKP